VAKEKDPYFGPGSFWADTPEDALKFFPWYMATGRIPERKKVYRRTFFPKKTKIFSSEIEYYDYLESLGLDPELDDDPSDPRTREAFKAKGYDWIRKPVDAYGTEVMEWIRMNPGERISSDRLVRMAYETGAGGLVLKPTGRVAFTRNLGWLLEYSGKNLIELVEIVTPAPGTSEAALVVRFEDGTVFVALWTSASVLWDWLDRPLFYSSPAIWRDMELGISSPGTIKKGMRIRPRGIFPSNNPGTGDPHLRRLERAAQAGDPEAQNTLVREQIRRGIVDPIELYRTDPPALRRAVGMDAFNDYAVQSYLDLIEESGLGRIIDHGSSEPEDAKLALAEMTAGLLDPLEDEELRGLFGQHLHPPSWQDAYMIAANHLLGGHGVERITGHDEDGDPYRAALYVNMGDEYVPTVVMDSDSHEVEFTTYADWLDAHPAVLEPYFGPWINCSRCGREAQQPGGHYCGECGEEFCLACLDEGPSAHSGYHRCPGEEEDE